MSGHRQPVLIQEALALDAYLTKLLAEMPDDLPEISAALDGALLEQPQTYLRPSAKTEGLQAKGLAEARPSVAYVQAAEEVSSSVHPKPQFPVALMPEWSRAEFQAIQFKIGDLVLATPLMALSRMLLFNRKLTKIPAQAAWILGILEENGRKIAILDGQQLIDGKVKGAKRDLEAQPFSNLLLCADSHWGVACDEVLSVVKIKPESVRWRPLRKIRPWLIGTSIDALVAIIDLNQLVPGKK